MHICEHPGCNCIVEDKYHFCFNHRKDIYKDYCKLHGLTDFREGLCLECKKLKRPMFRVYRRKSDGCYYLNRTKINSDHFLWKWRRMLQYHSRAYAMKYVGVINDGPGCYGIFKRDRRNKKWGIGECLYVGQSVNVKDRVRQHQLNIMHAEKQIKKNNGRILAKSKQDVAYMYYPMGQIGMDNLKIVRLIGISKKEWSLLNLDEALTLLSVMEQWCMDAWNPKYNVIAARNTPSSLFDKK